MRHRWPRRDFRGTCRCRARKPRGSRRVRAIPGNVLPLRAWQISRRNGAFLPESQTSSSFLLSLFARREQARAGTENAPVRPVALAVENLAVARFAVIPARQQSKMLAEILARGRTRLRGGFELRAQDFLHGARLAGEFSKAQEEWLGNSPGANREDGNRLPFRGALENDGVEILDAPRDFRQAAQDVADLVQAAMQRRRALEVERSARGFAFLLDFRGQRASAGAEKTHHAQDFRVVILFRAARKTRREAHFHFRINAARKRRVAADFDLAAPDLEKVQKFFGKRIGGAARRKRPVIQSVGWSARGLVGADAARDVAARVGVRQVHFQQRWRPQPRQFLIPAGKDPLRVLVIREGLLEARAGQAVTNGSREFAKVEPLCRRVRRAEQAFEAAPGRRKNPRRAPRRIRGCHRVPAHGQNTTARLSRPSEPRRRSPGAGFRWCLRKSR